MSDEKSTAPPAPQVQGQSTGLQFWYNNLYAQLRKSILPEIFYLEGEEEQLVIRMAPYRKLVGWNLLRIGGALLLVVLILLGISSSLGFDAVFNGVLGMLALALTYAVFYGAQTLLLYEQWQFILTNKRIILITPDPDQRGFADAIYLKQGKIQVLDTNWSHSPFWGFFQATTGSRDVMLSMSGYEFQETGARVKGGLRFPDVTQDDIRELKRLIFS